MLASDELRKELHKLIRSHGEKNDVTIYQAIGVVEIVKFELVGMLARARG